MSTRDPAAKITDANIAPQYTTRAIRARGGDDDEMCPDGFPRFTRSEGQRKLLDVDGTQEKIAEAIGAARQSLQDWRKGTRHPSERAVQRMYERFGIPVADWSKPWALEHLPASRLPPAKLAADIATITSAPATNAGAPPPPAPPPVSVNSTDNVLQLLAIIRADRAAPNLLPSEKVKLIDAESKLVKLLADLQARAELAEDRYVREHPAWQRVRNAIAEALKPHPAAATAVAEALDRLGL
jgi:transcriptional regulator with XRE-family HTH domain